MPHTLSACAKCHGINKVNSDQAISKRPVCGKCGAELPMHGLVSEVDTEAMRKILKASDVPVVVDFWASWCGPCQVYGPHFEEASLANRNTVFLKVNTESEQQLAMQLQVKGIPCTILFRNGVEVKRQAGAMDVAGIKSFLNS